jgi:hypothetical protein
MADDNPIPLFTEADLSESERAVYDSGEAVFRQLNHPPNVLHVRWIQKIPGPSYEERRKAEGW